MKIVPVSLGDRSYRILIGDSLLPRLGPECARLKLGRRCAVITDSNVGPLYAESALNSLRGAGFDPILIT
ncbi:MAG: 3-dehydroquinate synthase, partial [Verrucomicrobiae bacterium]|nr:3-dehydroquinate synthase [Verrucomicrobiae bacterium]